MGAGVEKSLGSARAQLYFGVLGPVRAWREGVGIDLGPARQRAVLAVLVLRSPTLVSDEQLLEDVWGEQAPASGVRVLRSYVSRLRHSLGPEVVDRVSGGYRLPLGAESLDLAVFYRLSAQARRLRRDGDPGSSAARWRDALELWRGDVLAGVPGPFAEAHRTALAELRSTAVEEYWDVELDLGHDARVTAELHAALAEHPLRERLAGMLMRSLSGCGRQAEALAVFFDTRKALAEELGVDPSADLQHLYQEMLVQPPPR